MNHNHITVPFLLLFASCTEKSYLCWNEKRTRAVAFSFDDTMESVTVEDLHSYGLWTSQDKPLDAGMPGGTHRLTMDEDSITLEVIQDSVRVKTKVPSGRFVDPKDIKTEEDYLGQRRYHAVLPFVHKYVFDRESIRLSLSYSPPLLPPRRAIEQKFVAKGGKYELYPEKVKDLSPEEASDIFGSSSGSTSAYPDCEEESHSMKRFVRSILRLLFF